MALLHREHCPVCGSAALQPVLEAKDFTVTGERFGIWECSACSGRFTQDVPDESHIWKYYRSREYISHSNTREGLVNRLYHLARNFSMRQKQHWIRRHTGKTAGSILDIGCGTGTFLHAMKKAGWQVTGIEPEETAREGACKLYGLDPLPAAELFTLPPGSFDAITLWHVLEHVHALHDYLKQIRLLLRPKGTLFLALPNFTSPDAQYYGEYWAAYDVPRHLYHFSPASIERLAALEGFHIRQQIPMPFDAFYVSLLSERYRHGSTRYLQGFRQGLRSYRHALRHPDKGSSIVYVLESLED
jgi:SAM-dependent methyltransferase